MASHATVPASKYEASSLQLVKSPPWFRRLALVLLGVLAIGVACLFVPWRQSVSGTGQVTVFSPMARPQTVESQIPGRIQQWYVIDGQHVAQGQVLLTLSEVDAKFLDPLQLRRLTQQRQALSTRRDAASRRFSELSQQLAALQQSRGAVLPAAEQRRQQAGDRLRGAQQALLAAAQNQQTADWQYERVQTLFERGLRSKRDQELALLDRVRTATEVQRAEAALAVAKRDTQVASLDVNRLDADTLASLQGIEASMAAAQETMASASNDLLKLEVDLWSLHQRVAQRTIRAPRAGRIVRLAHVGAGQTVDSGDTLVTIVPETTDQAVELFLADYDVPLVAVGRPVRLQFSGWPAVQFTGWPSVAVGTFAGRVAVIDMLDTSKGRYRILVRPDVAAIRAKREDPWPTSRFLRPGSSVLGWVMLDTVPLWFELWRIFNAFPPSLQQGQSAGNLFFDRGLGKDTMPTEDKTGEAGKEADDKPKKRKAK
jgi:multidrug resistance efflux pump